MELLVSAGQVLLGPTGQRITSGAVLIRHDTIAAVGTQPQVRAIAEPDIPVLSFPEGTLLPGLIDGHVHFAFDASPDPVGALRCSDLDLLLGMAGRAVRALDSGVTTVRDLGDRHGLALRLGQAITSGTLPGPRILAAGTPLTSPRGHCGFLGGEVEGEEAIRALVRRNAEAGAAVIKVMVTGGGLTTDGPPIWATQFSIAELTAAVEEARAAGLPVAAHAHGTDGIATAVAAGVDTIEHCTWVAADGGFEVREDLVVEMAAKGIRVCPAASPNWRAFAERFGADHAAAMFKRYRWLHDHGVGLLAGTDAGVPFAESDNPTGSLEFFDYVGFSRDQVIELATVSTAEALGIADRTGRIATGHRADLLVVDGDPLTDLSTLRRVRLVIADGRARFPAKAAIETAGHSDRRDGA